MADRVEDAAERLYALPLEEFTRERDAAARALRKEKERDAAAAVAKLPKPSQAAWAANALQREQRGLVDDLLEAGERLRAAQEATMAGGDAAALRKAGAAERAAVDALVEAARELRPGGRRPTDATLERLRTTLHAAAADDAVRDALEAGRLVEDVQGGGAWGLLDLGDAPPAPPRRRKARAKPREDDGERERERKAREAEEAEARRRLEAELREARAERRSRDRELERAERAAARAAERLEEAREQAEEAAAELAAAREAAEEARDHAARLEEQLD